MVGPRGVRLAPMIFICITIELLSVEGRKCVCTSRTCRAAGINTCRTRFACYTELILTDEGKGSTTTRGCTESATPLLCERRPRSAALDSTTSKDSSTGHPARVRWPHLRCCDSHDYCNDGVVLDPQNDPHRRLTSIPPQSRDPGVSPIGSGVFGGPRDLPSDPPDRNRDKKTLDFSAFTDDENNAGLNSMTLRHVKPLHVAALVLAVAALISVLAACYVVTSLAS